MQHHSHPLTREGQTSASRTVEAGAGRVVGQVKWFDFIKGYGFITSSERATTSCCIRSVCGNPDSGRFRKARPWSVKPPWVRAAGRRQTDLGRQFDRPTDARADRTGAALSCRAATDLPSKAWSNGSIDPKAMALFRAAHGTPDVFVHMETLRRCDIGELHEGQRVKVRIGQGPKGEMAAEVLLLEDQN